jgi:hypothetical protein
MRNKLFLSSTVLFSLLFVCVITISLFQFDVISFGKDVNELSASAANTEIAENSNAESNSSSKLISFFSFLLNFSKSAN